MENITTSFINANTIQLHYWFHDNSHTIDSFIQNKCEFEFLNVVKEIAKKFDTELVIETEPLAEGGLKRWYKLILKLENKNAIITTAVITALATGVFVTPITSSVSKITEKLIDNIFEDKELKQLEQDKLRLEIEKLKLDTTLINKQLNENTVIKKRRSNFYDALSKYPKISKVSFVIEDDSKNKLSPESIVKKESFASYILVTDDLEPERLENAIIDLISPVLKKGNYKWRGFYDGVPISFNMKSLEFKELVQTGKVEFNNNSTIKCLLEIKKKINNEGIIEITNYNIIRVDEYYENSKTMKTNEGKLHQKIKEAEKDILFLPFDKDKNEKID